MRNVLKEFHGSRPRYWNGDFELSLAHIFISNFIIKLNIGSGFKHIAIVLLPLLNIFSKVPNS